MDTQAVINAFRGFLNLCDKLDSIGGGVRGLTNGEHTTRNVCRIELGQFLLYIADGAVSITDVQAAFLDLVLYDDGTQIYGSDTCVLRILNTYGMIVMAT